MVAADLDGYTVVRLPARPGHPEADALHLHAPPDPDDIGTWTARWHERFPAAHHGRGPLLRWTAPLEAGGDGPARATADVHHVLERLRPVSPVADVEMVAPTDPRQWHGAGVLDRYAGDGHPLLEDRRRAAGEGRGVTRVAYRWGIPVATASLVWDPAAEVPGDRAGLAVVAGVVVHPAHRHRGIGTTLVADAVSQLGDRLGCALVTANCGSSSGLLERLGFRPASLLVRLEPEGA